jgi:hypothetical protein
MRRTSSRDSSPRSPWKGVRTLIIIWVLGFPKGRGNPTNRKPETDPDREEDAAEVVSTLQEAMGRGPNVFEAYDCAAPAGIQDIGYEPQDDCQANTQVVRNEEVSYQLLVEEGHVTITGYQCSLSRSQSASYCGAYDHQTRWDEGSYVSKPITVKGEVCKNWVENKLYKFENGKTTSLSMGDQLLTMFHAGKTWTLHGEVKCQGDTTTVSGKTLDSMVVFHEDRVTLEEVQYLVGPTEVRLAGTGALLNCRPHTGECHRDSATYIWNPPQGPDQDCTLANSRNMTGQLVENQAGKKVFMSTDQSMVRLILGVERILRCGREVYPTNYDKLFLMALPAGRPFTRKLDPHSTSYYTYIDNKDDFLYNHVKEALQLEYRSVLQDGCNQQIGRSKLLHWLQTRDPGLTTWIMGNGTYATTAGEVLYRYQCRRVYVKAVIDGLCYQGLKVDLLRVNAVEEEGSSDPRPRFLEPLTRRLTRHGISTPCSAAYRPKYLNVRGEWMMVAPNALVKGSKPHVPSWEMKEREILSRDWDWTQGGIYTPDQKTANEAYQDMDRALTDFASRLSKQTTPHDRMRELLPSHVFPSLSDPRSFLSEAYDEVLSFLSTWGKLAATCISIYLIGKAIFWIFNFLYGVIVLRHVHGCGRMIWWAACLKVMYLRQYRKFKTTQRESRQKEARPYESTAVPSSYEPSPGGEVGKIQRPWAIHPSRLLHRPNQGILVQPMAEDRLP